MFCKHRLASATAAIALVAMPAAARAHTLFDAADERLLAWSLDPFGGVLLLCIAGVYAVGQWRLARRARLEHGRRAALFWAGWGSLALALAPPIDALSAVSFAAHMTQHEIMMLVAAPLLVLARPLGTLLWGSPPIAAKVVKARAVRRTAAWLSAPLAAWLFHALVLWGWHVPAAFETALRLAPVHWLQHLSFFAAPAVYWWSVFAAGPGGERRGVALVSVFTTAVHTSVLGALLTFSTSPWYASYAHARIPWNLNPLEDQQLGGLIMWVPGGMVFVVVGLALTAAWLKESELRGARG